MARVKTRIANQQAKFETEKGQLEEKHEQEHTALVDKHVDAIISKIL